MLYAFDVGEARVAFTSASLHDPNLVFPYIGAALAETIDINRPSTTDGEKRGAAAIAKARAHLAHASEAERVLVSALGERYGAGTLRQRFARCAAVLDRYTQQHRDDPNLLVVAAFAIWDAEDALENGDGALTPKATELLADLDRALQLDPQNLGAHHLRIHLLENVDRAKDATSDAEALMSYVYPPGESHLPHMAGHIWDRLGDYDEMIAANERAVTNDRAWFALGNGPGQQYMHLYHDHDVDFILYGLSTLGRDDEARAVAQNEDVYERTALLIRLHDDAAALAELWPQAHFQRALLNARSGDVATARTELASLTGRDVSVQRALVDAALARRGGNLDAAVAAYRRAYDATKNAEPGDPKDDWSTPLGEGYGAALLAAHRAAEAEAVFSAELKRFPNDPHLEWGLAEAQKAQGKNDETARAAYRTHWKGSADLTLARLG
jgi:tetratricopeptide (TPR) repeat protein